MIKKLFIATFVFGVALGSSLNKVDHQLQQKLNKRATNVVVSFADTKQVLSSVNSIQFASRAAKLGSIKNVLEDHATKSQQRVRTLLDSSGVAYKSLWIDNRIYIKEASKELVKQIAAMEEVHDVKEEAVVNIMMPKSKARGSKKSAKPAQDEVQWNIEMIEAPLSWTLPGGNNGEGVVVGVIDTGVRHTHESIRGKMRSSYGWFDPSNPNSTTPVDAVSHGTHVTGIIVGSNGIGVAPGAQYIACRGCPDEGCSQSALTECGQWMMCPTLANGEDPKCDMAPPVVSNSWAAGRGNTWFYPIIDAWIAAGIIPVFANGNDGMWCDSSDSPADHEGVIAVGATNIDERAFDFSGKGPTPDGRVKPDICAPGEEVTSAYGGSDDDYSEQTGTSMATPHVTGVIALLLSQNPNLTASQVKSLLYSNTDTERLGRGDLPCGGIPLDVFPNNVYGHGRLNARKSLAAAINGTVAHA